MIRRPPRSTRTDTLFPYTTLFRSTASFILLFRVESAFQSRYLLVPPTLRLRRCSYSSLGIPCKNRSTSSMTLTLGVTPCVGLPRTPKIALIDSKDGIRAVPFVRSDEHTSELQSLMRISYAVSCLKQLNIQ